MPAVAKTRRIENEVLAVLSNLFCTDNSVQITDGQLDRKLYKKLNEVLEALGGTWNRKLKAHVFENGDPQELIETAILTGGYTKPGDMGWFPTPINVVERMLVGLQNDMRVLEPSAGLGDIADEIAKHLPITQIDVVELDFERAKVLADKKYNLTQGNFLEVTPDQKYDRVIMNPPFAPRQADIDHVLHAHKFLKAGGHLISVMGAGVKFRENTKTVDFRTFVADHDGSIVDLPEDSFKLSGTSVNTVLVTICG